MQLRKILNIFKQIALVSRPFSWINTGAPFAAGYILATASLDTNFWLGTLYFLFPYNLAMYGINDIYDYESDIRNPRKGSLEGSIVSPQQRKLLWWSIALTNIPFLIFFATRGDTTSNLVLMGIVFFCISYSLKGLRFKEIPVLDSINSSLHFVGPLVFGLALGQAANYPWAIIISFFFWGMASQAFGAIQDIKPDRAGSIKSIATYFGARRTTTFTLALYSIAAAIPTLAYWPHGIVFTIILSVYSINVLFFKKYKSDAKSHEFRRGWKNFLWLNWIAGFWIVQVLLFMLDPFNLGSDRYLLIAICLAVIGFGQLMLAAYNMVVLKRPPAQRGQSELPKVSVLIYALNQAENINSTLLAVLGQSYPDFEVLFTDLGSSDNTLKLASGFQDNRLRIMEIPEPESGWEIGPWATEQLALHAEGEKIVFLAADTILMPNTLATIVQTMERGDLDLVSLLPADQNKSLAQKLILSQNHFFLLGCYPAGLIEHKHPDINLAYSGLIGINRQALTHMEGLSGIKKSPIPEIELARLVSSKGLKTGFFIASKIATSQNYARAETIVRQNVRRYYPALGYNMPLSIAAISFGAFLFVTPGIGLGTSLITGSQSSYVWLLAYLAGFLPRVIVSTTNKQGVIAAVFYPITNTVGLLSLGFSMISYELLRPRWQERTETS